MSNHSYVSLAHHGDWPGQGPFVPYSATVAHEQSYHHDHRNHGNLNPSTDCEAFVKAEKERNIGLVQDSTQASEPTDETQLDSRGSIESTPVRGSLEHNEDASKFSLPALVKHESFPSTATPGLSTGSTSVSMEANGGDPELFLGRGEEDTPNLKDDEDEDVLLDDEDMLDGETPGRPQTTAERTAQRRKMKRFRLTHQQTRFLMSEFAKQPHPDAAHRERLSREIPGLSPRQVQVWFQNRRAKIKRLTADDRDRMIKMLAVPDDFDNVQALHSPYGAVHGLGPTTAHSVEYEPASAYAEHMMRPLVVDVRRGVVDDELSHTGLSPAFNSIGCPSQGVMPNGGILSPFPNAHERYPYSSNVSIPQTNTRTSIPSAGGSHILDTSLTMHHQAPRQQARPLQPLQLRDTLSRARSDSLQSPLRSSMSWKGDAIDYSKYHPANGSPSLSSRHVSGYHAETPTSMGAYDANHYNSSSMASPTQASSSSFSFSNPQNRTPRSRAASATLPMGLDLRNQYSPSRPKQPSLHSPTGRQAPTSAQFMSTGPTSSHSLNSGFPTGPLTAPIDYSMHRSPACSASATTSNAIRDYMMPQMSAPIAQPSDFSHAFRASIAVSAQTPIRHSFPTSNNPGTRTAIVEELETSADQHPTSSPQGHMRSAEGISGGELRPLERKTSFHTGSRPSQVHLSPPTASVDASRAHYGAAA